MFHQIEITTKCNFRCFYCAGRTMPQRHMTEATMNDILARLNQNTLNHTDSIMQMSKTFSTSEKFLKYVISRQNKQFIWLFAVSLSVCFIAIAVLAGIIVYLSRSH